jgi:hypothetical protein
MNIPAAQVKSKRRCGRTGSRAVWHASTVGGFHIIAAARDGGGMEILGTGSHPAVARFLARRAAPDIEFDDLQKSVDDPRDFADLIPQAAMETAYMRKLQGYDE